MDPHPTSSWVYFFEHVKMIWKWEIYWSVFLVVPTRSLVETRQHPMFLCNETTSHSCQPGLDYHFFCSLSALTREPRCVCQWLTLGYFFCASFFVLLSCQEKQKSVDVKWLQADSLFLLVPNINIQTFVLVHYPALLCGFSQFAIAACCSKKTERNYCHA